METSGQQDASIGQTQAFQGDIPVDEAGVQVLPKNSFGIFDGFFLCLGALAPTASMLFNVPVGASQAGASIPLVFVLSAFAVLLPGITVIFFARRLSSAGDFSTWGATWPGYRSSLARWLVTDWSVRHF